MIDLAKLDKWSAGKCFDHSVLPKNTTETDIREGCKLAAKYNCAAFYSSSPYWTPIVVEELKGTDVLPATGIDFPFGAAPSKVKALEAEMAVEAGCRALDLCMNLGALKSGRHDEVRRELKDFMSAAGGALTKVILDVGFLTDEEIVAGTNLIAEAGCDYVKTASGQFDGPSMDQFLIIKKALEGTGVKLKVSGVKFPRPQNAYVFLLAGAELIGTRAAGAIIDALDQMREIGLVPKYTGN